MFVIQNINNILLLDMHAFFFCVIVCVCLFVCMHVHI